MCTRLHVRSLAVSGEGRDGPGGIHMAHAIAVWKSALHVIGWAWVAGASSRLDEVVSTTGRLFARRGRRFPVAPVSKEWLKSYASDAAKHRFDR